MYWHLPSNSGRNLATWTVNDQTAEHFTCDFEFRSETPETNQPEITVQFYRLTISKTTLAEFVDIATRWLGQPLSDVASMPFETSLDIGGGFDNYVLLRFGENESIICSLIIAANFEYHIAGVSGQFGYAIDQTCLRAMVEGISAALGASDK